MTFDFAPIFDWRLLQGSHDFPGPDGGTCINEAAIIAAGFKYKKVESAADCPPCFSPVLSAYLIGINDLLPDDERQKLMPFIMRLSGSADASAVEQQRFELIVLRTVQLGVSSAMRAAGLADHAEACQAVKTFEECGAVAANAATAANDVWAASAAWAARAANAANAANAAASAASAANAASAAWATWAARAASAARAAWAARAALDANAARAARAARAALDANAARAARAAKKKLNADCIATAQEAFAIGKQAERFDVCLIEARLERAKEAASAA